MRTFRHSFLLCLILPSILNSTALATGIGAVILATRPGAPPYGYKDKTESCDLGNISISTAKYKKIIENQNLKVSVFQCRANSTWDFFCTYLGRTNIVDYQEILKAKFCLRNPSTDSNILRLVLEDYPNGPNLRGNEIGRNHVDLNDLKKWKMIVPFNADSSLAASAEFIPAKK